MVPSSRFKNYKGAEGVPHSRLFVPESKISIPESKISIPHPLKPFLSPGHRTRFLLSPPTQSAISTPHPGSQKSAGFFRREADLPLLRQAGRW